jgi:hypothetical protein
LFIGYGISVGEKDGSIHLPGVVRGYPIEIAFTVGGKAEALAPVLGSQVKHVFLAFEIERQEGLDPFGGVLRLGGIFWIGGRTADFDLLSEDGFMIAIESDKSLREQRANSPLNLLGIGMYQSAAERIPRGQPLLRSEAIAVLMQEAARAVHCNKEHESNGERAEGLSEERLHLMMILKVSAKKRQLVMREKVQAQRLENLGQSGSYVSLAEVVTLE